MGSLKRIDSTKSNKGTAKTGGSLVRISTGEKIKYNEDQERSLSNVSDAQKQAAEGRYQAYVSSSGNATSNKSDTEKNEPYELWRNASASQAKIPDRNTPTSAFGSVGTADTGYKNMAETVTSLETRKKALEDERIRAQAEIAEGIGSDTSRYDAAVKELAEVNAKLKELNKIRPTYDSDKAKSLQDAFTTAENDLIAKRGSVENTVSDLDRLGTSISSMESNLEQMAAQFDANPTQDIYDRYASAYKDYEKAIAEYNALYADYKPVYDSYSAYDDYMTAARSGDSIGDILSKAAWSGIGQFNSAVTRTLALPEVLLQKLMPGVAMPLTDMADYFEDIRDKFDAERAESVYNRGAVTQRVSDLTSGAVAALPQAAIAMMTMGTSAAAQGGTLLTGAGNTGLAASVGNSLKEMVQNPSYWYSVIQTLGSDYEEAKEKGAGDLEALTSAIISSALNAKVEIGGGLETLPHAVKEGGTDAVLEWVKSALDEGKEEVIQSIISGITAKTTYDPNRAIFSMSDDEAIVNPSRLAEEFAMGAGVGAVLGGGQIATNALVNSMIDREMQKVYAQNDAVERITSPDGSFTTAEQNSAERVLGVNTEAYPNADVGVQAAYEAGKAELPRSRANLETDEQIYAYEQGRKDAILTQQKPIENTDATAYTDVNETKEGLRDGGDVYLHESGQRNVSTDSQEQVSAVEEGAGRDQSGYVQGKSADREAAQISYGRKVSTADLGITGGVSSDSVYLVDSNSTTATREAQRIANERGLELVLFAGGDLHTAEVPDGARGYTDGKRIFARVDDADFTAAQIARHEAGHDMIAKGEVDVQTVRERCKQVAPNGNLDALASQYEHAYAGMDADEIWEEMICDSLGDMNVFGVFFESKAGDYADAMQQVTKSVDDTKQETRGPPTESDGKYSKYWRPNLSKSEWSLLNNRMDQEIEDSAFNLDDATKWVYANEKGTTIFAFYGIGDGTEATVLYASSGKKAQSDNTILQKYLEGYGNEFDKDGAGFDKWIKSVRSQQGNRRNDFRDAGRGTKVSGDDKLHGESQKGDGTGASGTSKENRSGVNGEKNDTAKYSRKLDANIAEMQSRLDEMNREYQQMGWKEHEFKTSKEYRRFMDDISREDVDNDYLDWSIKAYGEWEQKSGYAELSKKMESMRGEMKTLRGNLERAKEQAAKEARIEYRAKYNEEFAKKYASKAARKFGTTSRFDLAGYLTVNGTLLDFSERQGYRVQDHREIAEVLDFLPEEHGYSDGLVEFMNLGNIRLQSYGIDISKAPNKAQISQLRKFFNSLNGEVTVDFSDEDGGSVGSLEYPEGTRADKILSDIDSYFKTGKVPEQSETSMFHNWYSRRLKTYEDLQQENEDLRERLSELQGVEKQLAAKTKQAEYWKGQTKRADRNTLRQADVDKLAKRIVSEFEGTIDAAEVSGPIKELGEYILRGGNEQGELTWAGVKERAVSIAQDIVGSSVTLVNGDEVESYNEIKKLLRRKMSISAEDSHDIADFASWKKEHSRRINVGIDNGGLAVDVAYQELSESYPWAFPAEVTAPSDQLLQMADVLYSMQPIYENPYSANMMEAVEYCANSIIDGLLDEDVRQTAPTFADKQSAKLEEEKAKGRAQAADAKAAKKQAISDATLAGQMAQGRADAKRLRASEQRYEQRLAAARQAIEDERVKRDERVQRLKDHYANVRANQQAKRADSKSRTRLLNIARRLKNKKLPAANRALLNQYIGELDTVSKSMTGKTLEKLTDLQAWYNDRKENDPDFIADPVIERKLERLAKRQISSMTSEEVADLTDTLLNIEHELQTERKLIDTKDRRDVYHMGEETIENISNTRGSNGNAVDKFIVTETLSPVREMRRMTGYVDSDPLLKATNSLADGQRNMLDYQMKAERPFERFANDKVFSRMFSGKQADAIQVTGETKDGPKTVTITPAMRTALYLHSLNNQNMRHIKDGGITVPDEKLYRAGKLSEAYARGTTIKLTPSQVRSITAHMTDKERSFALAAQKYFNDVSKKSINETSEKLKGYSLADVENYFPINTDSSFTRSDFESLKFDGTIEGMGFLKERVNAANPILLRDANAVLEQAIQMHSKYVGLAIPVRNFNKIWSVTTGSFNEDGSRNNFEGSVQNAIKGKWGEAGYSYVEKMMSDLQGGQKQKNVWAGAMNKLRSNYAGAVLTLNLSVAMKQAASYPTAAAVLGWTPLVKAMGNAGKVDLALIEKYTPLQWYRSKGFSTKELGDLKSSDKALPAVLNWVQGVDLATTRKLWKASEYYVQMHNKSLERGSDAYYREVADIYNRVIEETQPNYTTMQRPQLLRSDDTLMGNLAMFKTQPFQNFNILYDAGANLQAKKERAKSGEAQAVAEFQQAKTDFGHAVTSQLAQLAVFAGMTAAWAMMRGKPDKYEDEENDEITMKSFLAAYAKDMVGGAMSSVPFGSDAWELISSKVFGDKYYGMDVVTVSAITDTVKSVSSFAEMVSRIGSIAIKGDEIDWNKERLNLDSILDDVSKAAGVPYENVVNMVNMVVRNAAIIGLGDYKGKYAYLKLTTDPEKYSVDYYDLLYKAMKESKADYQEIYSDMIAFGFDEKKISNAMETRMKTEQGVKKVEDLDNRYLPPDRQAEYDSTMSSITGSKIWRNANEAQRDALEERLYGLVMESGSYKSMQEKIDDGAAYGVTDAEYLLFRTALEMVDKPTESGKLGSYTNEEVQEAIAMLKLSDAESAYLWESQGKSEKSNPWR